MWWLFCLCNSILNFMAFCTHALVVGRTLKNLGIEGKVWSRISLISYGDRYPGLSTNLIGMVFSLLGLFLPELRSLRINGKTVGRANLYMGVGPVFKEPMFDGDVALILSEGLGYEYLKRPSLPYRQARVLMREQDGLQADNKIKEKGNDQDEKSKNAHDYMKSEIDIAFAGAKQMLIRLLGTTFFQNLFNLCFQCDVLLIQYHLHPAFDLDFLKVFMPLRFSACCIFLTLLDYSALSRIVHMVDESATFTEFPADEKSVNGITLKRLRRQQVWVLALEIVIVCTLLYNCIKVTFACLICDSGLFGLFHCLDVPLNPFSAPSL